MSDFENELYKNRPACLGLYIGTPALLEQTAEEATELAFTCLKLARHIRNENMVHMKGPDGEELSDYVKENKLIDHLEEEAADVLNCMDELQVHGIMREQGVRSWMQKKRTRMRNRLKYKMPKYKAFIDEFAKEDEKDENN